VAHILDPCLTQNDRLPLGTTASNGGTKSGAIHGGMGRNRAGNTVVAKDRVAKAKTQLAEEAKEGRAASRAAMKAEQIKVLLKLENEKMDMIEVVIVEAAKRLTSAE